MVSLLGDSVKFAAVHSLYSIPVSGRKKRNLKQPDSKLLNSGVEEQQNGRANLFDLVFDQKVKRIKQIFSIQEQYAKLGAIRSTLSEKKKLFFNKTYSFFSSQFCLTLIPKLIFLLQHSFQFCLHFSLQSLHAGIKQTGLRIGFRFHNKSWIRILDLAKFFNDFKL